MDLEKQVKEIMINCLIKYVNIDEHFDGLEENVEYSVFTKLNNVSYEDVVETYYKVTSKQHILSFVFFQASSGDEIEEMIKEIIKDDINKYLKKSSYFYENVLYEIKEDLGRKSSAHASYFFANGKFDLLFK